MSIQNPTDLIGKKIKDVEPQENGCPVLILDDDSILFPLCDPEGNGPGGLHRQSKDPSKEGPFTFVRERNMAGAFIGWREPVTK